MINDKLWYTAIRFLKQKSQATQHIQNYITHLNVCGHNTHAICVDRGTEFLNNTLKTWCAKHGIEIQTTAPYLPSQNRVIEQMNRTIVKLAHAMINMWNLPEFLWEPAVAHAQESWVKTISYKLYKEGDQVWLEGTNLHTTHPMWKLGPKRYGPFKVWEMVGQVNFRLKLPSHWRIHNIFHAKLLHPYKETEEHGENFTKPPPDLVDGEPEWEVEQILDMRTQWSGKQYLIRWKGYSSAHNSWEPQWYDVAMAAWGKCPKCTPYTLPTASMV